MCFESLEAIKTDFEAGNVSEAVLNQVFEKLDLTERLRDIDAFLSVSPWSLTLVLGTRKNF